MGDSGLNASLAISEAVAPSAPLKMASLFIGMTKNAKVEFN